MKKTAKSISLENLASISARFALQRRAWRNTARDLRSRTSTSHTKRLSIPTQQAPHGITNPVNSRIRKTLTFLLVLCSLVSVERTLADTACPTATGLANQFSDELWSDYSAFAVAPGDLVNVRVQEIATRLARSLGGNTSMHILVFRRDELPTLAVANTGGRSIVST